jgi:hypothetical protein
VTTQIGLLVFGYLLMQGWPRASPSTCRPLPLPRCPAYLLRTQRFMRPGSRSPRKWWFLVDLLYLLRDFPRGAALSTRRDWISVSRATFNGGPWGLAACSLPVAGPCTLLSLTGSRDWVSTIVGKAESPEVSSACAGCSPLAPSSPKLVAVGTSS